MLRFSNTNSLKSVFAMERMIVDFRRLSAVFFIFCWSILVPDTGTARHKCPSPPQPTNPFLTTTFVPSASSAATTKVSNTSGCGRGHPSDSFYRPQGAIYIEEMREQVSEQSAQGDGAFLEVLAGFAGCPATAFDSFATSLQGNYARLFNPPHRLSLSEQADWIWQEVETIVETQEELQALCSVAS